MGIRLGNLTVSEVENKHKFEVSKEDREVLEAIRQDDAQHIEEEAFHIFDLPMTTFVCGSLETRNKVVDTLQKYNPQIKGQIIIGFSKEDD